jgi:hypothetical protein
LARLIRRSCKLLPEASGWDHLHRAAAGSPRSDQDSERRVYPHFAAPKRTIVAWHRFNKRAVSAVDNLGLGGLFIRTPDPPPAGTFIQLLIDSPTGEVRVRAAVQRSSPTDVVMPNMQGPDLAKRSLRPDIKIIYMSGYLDLQPRQWGVLGGRLLPTEAVYARHFGKQGHGSLGVGTHQRWPPPSELAGELVPYSRPPG